MSRTRRAILGAGFQYAQLGLTLVSGAVIFPLTIRAVGVDTFGVWLATGEVVGYLVLGDLGVLTILPILVAARDGAGDRPGITRLTTDGFVVAAAAAGVVAAAAVGVWFFGIAFLGTVAASQPDLGPALITVLGLAAAGMLVRPLSVVLQGFQDVVFCGWLGLAQAALTAGLTIGLVVVGGCGIVGLAVSTALPPVLVGLTAGVRILAVHPDVLRMTRPSGAGVWYLIREGFGSWLSGFGVRLLTGSASVILAGAGRAADATLYAATLKAGQLLQIAAWILPDSALVGVSQVRSAGRPDVIRRTVLSLLAMALLLNGTAAFAVLAGNAALVRVWLGPGLFAGHVVNAAIAANIVAGALVTGLFKAVGVAGYRPAVGVATIVYGGLSAALAFGLGRYSSLAWVAAAPVLAAAGFAIPLGLWLLPKVYPVSAADVVGWWLAWAGRSAPFLAAAAIIGWALADNPVWCFTAAIALGLVYLAAVRPLIVLIPWPATAARILSRVRVIPAGLAPEPV
jgi:O-antigen/teichoic acid export membrane protein